MPFDNIPVEYSPLQVLITARELIDQGWVQNAYMSKSYIGGKGYYMAVCMVGAYRHAFAQHRFFGDADVADVEFASMLASHIPLIDRFHYRLIGIESHRAKLIAYNDSRGQTKEAVLKVFDKAIKAERKKENRKITSIAI